MEAVELRATQAKLGTIHQHPLTLSQLMSEFDPDATPNGQATILPTNSQPNLFKSKTADDAAQMKEVGAYMSATDGQGPS